LNGGIAEPMIARRTLAIALGNGALVQAKVDLLVTLGHLSGAGRQGGDARHPDGVCPGERPGGERHRRGRSR